MIIADSREPRGLVDTISRAVAGDVSRAFLDSADYVIFDDDGCSVGIERKTVLDFLQSFSTGRLVKQLNKLKQRFVPILLLEGNFTLMPNMRIRAMHRDTGWHHSAIQMALLAVQREGVRVLYTPDHRGTADILRILNKRAEKGCALVGAHSLLDVWPQGDDPLIEAPKPRRPKRLNKPEPTTAPGVKL